MQLMYIINCDNWWWVQNLPSMPRYDLWEWCSLEHGLGSQDMETKSLLDVVLFLSSSLPLFCWLRPTTNSVCIGCDHLPLEVEWPYALYQPEGCHWAWQIGYGTYWFIQSRTLDVCFILCFPRLPFFSTSFGILGGLHHKMWMI